MPIGLGIGMALPPFADIIGSSGPGAGVDDLLMETGDHLLLEIGDAILLE